MLLMQCFRPPTGPFYVTTPDSKAPTPEGGAAHFGNTDIKQQNILIVIGYTSEIMLS